MTLNLKEIMAKQLSKDVLSALKICSLTANECGFKIYLIGGVVRDLIFKKNVLDIDVTVVGDATDLCHIIADKKLCKILQVQNDLKTVKAMFANRVIIDFASTRQELYPRRGHLPVVVRIGCSLEEDVYRRDFTINSLAMSLNRKDFGDVTDYVGGVEDLKNKTLKVLHDNSFNEDPSRIIRGLKFAARFGLHRDPKTKELQNNYIKNGLHDDISWSRIKSELKQTFSLNDAKVFDMFLFSDVQKLVNGEKPEFTGLEIKTLIDKYHPEMVWLVYLGCVLKNEKTIDAMCFTRAEKKVFTDTAYLLKNNLKIINSNYDIFKFFEKRTMESVLISYLLTQRKEALIYLEKLSQIRIEISGEELKTLGIAEGKEIGEMLDKILKKKLNGNIISKADEIDFVKSEIK